MKAKQIWGKLTIAIVVFYFAFTGNRGLWNLYKLHQEKNNLTEQITYLKSEIAHYQTVYQSYNTNNGIVEKQAREELDLIKPGEIVYKFRGDESH